jgi:alanine racemase
MTAPAIATGYGGRMTVDLAAMRRNWLALDKVSQGALTAAVVKADAYGTGIALARVLPGGRPLLFHRDT